jgi:peptidoglycan/xylan/chitin deacetylase (PgdA/CDA1 family)
MILMYHNVASNAPTKWHVSTKTFDRQMAYLTAYDVVYLADYDPRNPQQVVITFDDGYSNVVEYALPILEKWNYPFEIFVIGNHIGKSNSFDRGNEPEARCAGIDELKKAANSLARLQWHTRSHPRLATISLDLARHELDVPTNLTDLFARPHFTWFAYPYGNHSDKIVREVRQRFDGAVSTNSGSDRDRYQLNRIAITENSPLFLSSQEKDVLLCKMEKKLAVMETMVESRSWRYSAPLRALTEFARRIKDRATR